MTGEEQKLKTAIEQYQRRLNQTPVREQQLAGILRNYEQLKLDYTDLLNKESQSRMAADLEKRQEGQQFRLVDQPSLPTVPSSPNRIKISLNGVAGGIGLGLALAFIVNLWDRSFRSEKELGRQFTFPIMVSVPLFLTPREQQVRAWKRNIQWVAGAGLALAVVAAELYEYYLYRHG
jgi:capsular polysaccharide biosynthesis protein